MAGNINFFLTKCSSCRQTTSKKHAKENHGWCKECASAHQYLWAQAALKRIQERREEIARTAQAVESGAEIRSLIEQLDSH